MDSKMIWIVGFGLVIVVIIFLIAMIVSSYNGMVTLNQNVESSWSEVENQYQRQADLIPNLISIVSSAVSVETKFVQGVIEARTKWLNASSIADKDKLGVEMNQSLTTFVNAIATNEAYPALQSNQQYTALMDEVAGTQNRIAVSRGRYIENVRVYNTSIKTIPNNFFAGMFGFSEKEYYQANENSLNTPSLGEGVLPK
ncbi:MAG: LemA family protein [Candidatus Iainarchaeum sp.]|jgi:LemA protein|nr:MAG: LemA family protein [archaeon ADurb.Bin336]